MRSQRGIAIITAVAIAAMVAAIASAMAWRYTLWFRQVENQHDLAQARLVARAAVDLSRLTLQDDARRAGQADFAGEPWAIPIPNLPVEQGTAGGKIEDAQGRFNLNNLWRNNQPSDPDILAFRRLLLALELPADLSNAVLDWIDPDDEPRAAGGAEDGYYLTLSPPYRAANRQLLDLSDLEKIRGFDAEVLRKLQPFVTALPGYTPINLNFAPAEVIAAVVSGLTPSASEALVKLRESKAFITLDDFRAALPNKALAESVRSESVGVASSYFITDVDARFGRVSVAYRALLERNGTQTPRVVWMRRR